MKDITTRLSENNIQEYLYNCKVGKNFSINQYHALRRKEKTDQSNSPNIKDFYISQYTKRRSQETENTQVAQVSDRTGVEGIKSSGELTETRLGYLT